ncbi:hypothetical protein SAMN04487968_109148 [Nocardioides terrae]|uniref:Uncharacterized protein n=1 Tax=Nocardioides terrae TaxID=574651 RepID=A0A1I1LC74_9ACTN|nr:hypothetical protein [Nocardioides terrae]SFC67983.1 hypothetical protein SAMN04487968_109148 [Nocardioides terrae]
MSRIAVVPGCLALLPAYASLRDPVAPLRVAALSAVEWLGPDVEVVGSDAGRRVGAALLDEVARAGAPAQPGDRDRLVVLNGSACRTEKAPGYLDPRAEAYDALLGAALAGPDLAALKDVDLELGRELLADVEALPALVDALAGAELVSVDYADAPYGVQYWVMRWERP